MSAFKVPTTKKLVDPNALAAFSGGAEEHVTFIAPRDVPKSNTEKSTESLLFRLTKSDLEEFNFVFENTNIKSKQKLLEAIILPEIRRRALEIKGK